MLVKDKKTKNLGIFSFKKGRRQEKENEKVLSKIKESIKR